jgi:hypothetical protein
VLVGGAVGIIIDVVMVLMVFSLSLILFGTMVLGMVSTFGILGIVGCIGVFG